MTYAVAEAEALLPELTVALVELGTAVALARDQAPRVAERARWNAEGSELFLACATIRRVLHRCDELDVAVRDPDTGLIDFPGERDGEPVWLCWRLGEDPVIKFWHPIDRGFDARRPLAG